MTRILYVHHGKGIGGAPLSLLYLLRGLDRTRYEPTVLCIHESEASALFRAEGFETIVLPGVSDFSHTNVLWYPWWQAPKLLLRTLQLPLTVLRAQRFFARRRFDIVHLNTSTLLAFGMAAHRAGMRVVWHVREPIARGYLGVRRMLVRRIIDRNADVIIPISAYDGGQLLPTDRIHVVYNFVDFAVFDPSRSGPDARRALDIPEGARVVLMLGGINPIKGTREFVDAAVSLLRGKKDAVFLIAGQVPERTLRARLSGIWRYWSRIRRAIPPEHASSIRFLGVRTDVPALLAAADVLCFPSTVPHFARPVIEASAMGVPVVASDLGGPQELVLPGVTGLLTPARDSAALASAVAGILDDASLAAAMSAAGMAFARERFDAAKNTRAVMELYDGLAARP